MYIIAGVRAIIADDTSTFGSWGRRSTTSTFNARYIHAWEREGVGEVVFVLSESGFTLPI